MIHHQRRRDLPATPPQEEQPASGHASQVTAHEDTDPAVAPTAPPVVPQQERRPARDAYDLYAQIYAIRTEDQRGA